MSNLLASIGRGQLIKLKTFIDYRRKIFERYFRALNDIDGFSFIFDLKFCKSNRWLTVLTIDPKKSGIHRDQIIRALEEENIESRPVWKPMHLQPLFRRAKYIKKDRVDNSKTLFKNGICLPSGSNLSKKDQSRVIRVIKSFF